MAEQDKQYTGDGNDNYAQAAQKGAQAGMQAGKEAGKEAAKQAVTAGAEAASNAAAHAVNASVQAGSAVSEIAVGTASGGPVGAALAAVWALRHSIFKFIVCVGLVLVFLITAVISLPSLIFNSIFQTDPGTADVAYAAGNADMYKIADDMSEIVNLCVQDGYDVALAKVEKIIEDNGYDYEASMEALINYGASSPDYDVCYIFAAYSASMEQKGTTGADMKSKLSSVKDSMFRVSYEEKEFERVVPVTYSTYKSTTVTVVTGKTLTGTINGVPQYRYETAAKTYYVPDEQKTSDTTITVDAYNPVSVDIPVRENGKIVGTRSETYYQSAGSQTLEPASETVKYAECTIWPFDQGVINTAFGIDPGATYGQFGANYGQAIETMAYALKMTLYGSVGNGSVPVITDVELLKILENLDCSATRKEMIRVALSLVGRVPYFWGGKSAAGWNEEWNTPKLVTAAGSSSSGTIRPYGLDCSGFTDWVYKTAGLGPISPGGSSGQWDSSYEISKEELLPGDLGFMARPGEVGINHVLMYVGEDDNGNMLWVHCSSGSGVVLNSPTYVKHYRRVKDKDLESNVVPGREELGELLYTLRVNVTHYCACAKCCGQWADGITASGKKAQPGMVAMSSYYPFGTKLMINGQLYVVEDRGDSGIENDKTRVDIFVYDHQEALRLGRYWTEATFYR